MKTFQAITPTGEKVLFSIAYAGDMFFTRAAAMAECDRQGWFLKGIYLM